MRSSSPSGKALASRRAKLGLIALCLAIIPLITASFARFALRWVPLPPALFSPAPAQTELTDRHGTPLRVVRAADRPFASPVTYAEIPQSLVQATLAAEDQRFWNHPGVDWRGCARAALSLVRHRRIISGGSSITQQLIKLAQPHPRTFHAKFIEALQALRLEQIWDKPRILTEYLNRVEYGNFNTGCAAAAEYYFGKPLRDLSTAECALLAGLPQAPSRLNPFPHRERALKREWWILGRMEAAGWLTSSEWDRARSESLRLASPPRAFKAPHFVDLLLQEANDLGTPPGSAGAFSEGKRTGRVRTSLDLGLNDFVQECLHRQIAELHSRHVGNGAVVIIDNRSGGIRALVGSANYASPDAGQVNGAWAPRSAGSSFKPFTYLLAFERGATPASIVADIPTEFATATGIFAPVNYDRRCLGPVRYRLALANSLNIAAVKVLASIGGPAVLQNRLQACGLTTLNAAPEHYGLGLTIGNAEARLLELANAYATLARLGEYLPCTFFDRSPNTATGTSAPKRRVFGSAAAYLVADILTDNSARTLAFGPESSLRFDFPVACKTGTSSDFRDNWAFGYTPEFTVGVWVGNFDGSSMQGISGVTGAAPILHDIFADLHRRFGTSWYPQPDTITQCPVYSVIGKRLRDGLPTSPGDWILEKFLKTQLPPFASDSDFDAQGRVRLTAEYRAWFNTSDNWLAGRAAIDGQQPEFRITYPLSGTIFFLDPDLPDSGRRIRVQAVGASEIEWHSPTLPCLIENHQWTAILEPGDHCLLARNKQTGATIETRIQVLDR
jgi:penicillin-binding protein 1C